MLEGLKTWYEEWGKKLLFTILGVIGVYIFFKYIFGLVAPFVFAWLFSMMLAPVVNWLNKKLKMNRGLGTILSMATILCTLLGIIVGVIQQIGQQVRLLKADLPGLQQQVGTIIDNMEYQIERLGREIPLPEAFQSMDDIIKEIISYISIFIDDIVTGVYDVITKVPNAMFFVIIMFIAIFFMTKDYLEIKEFVKAQIPENVTDKIVVMQKGLKNALGGYVRTQLIMMCLTFSICLVGLLVLGRKYVLVIAISIAIFDALPVFGSGAILIPWGIYSLVAGQYAVGVGLLCVYALIVVTRQIVEPKVLSNQIGVYALVTLMAIYIGLQTMGVIGMIVGPVVVVMFKTLQTLGIIPPFKTPNKR